MKIELLKSQNIELSKLETNKGQIEGLPKNPRHIKSEKYEKLKKSIEDNPEMLGMREVLVYPHGSKFVIIGGNMRFQACKELQFETVPCKVLDKDMTAEQLRAITIKDNVGFGEHDWELLANEWDSVELEEWGLEVPNFETEETILEAEEDDYEEPDNLKVDVLLGDLIEFECTDGRVHRLICGDSTDSDQVAKLMNGEKADMVFTDPPYNVDFKGQELSNTTKDGIQVLHHKGANSKHEKIKNDSMPDDDFIKFMKEILSNVILFNQGAWYFSFCDLKLDLLLTPLKEMGFNWKSIIIWKKNQATLSGKDYKSRYEPIVYGCPENSFYGERYKQEDIWEFQRTLKNDLHPTMKPIPLIENALSNSSKIGMTIMDLFLGSGSTMVAAHQLKRKCYGMELDPKYCQVIIDRMTKLDSTIKVKINGKDYANT